MDWMQQLMQMLSGMRQNGPAMPMMPMMGQPQSNSGFPFGIPAPPPPLPPAFAPPPRPLPLAPAVASPGAARPMGGMGMGAPILSGGGSGQERNNGMNAQFFPKRPLGQVMQPKQAR